MEQDEDVLSLLIEKVYLISDLHCDWRFGSFGGYKI